VQATTIDTIRFISERTIYSRFGDVAAWGSLALTVAALLATIRR
jgi:apolipoprotein N-acyltransferase